MALKIDTQIIRSTANSISTQNEKLLETLNQSQKTVQDLAAIWTGEASEATIRAYNSFAGKYFQKYHDTLDTYVKFLNGVAGEGYEQVETKVTQKSGEI